MTLHATVVETCDGAMMAIDRWEILMPVQNVVLFSFFPLVLNNLYRRWITEVFPKQQPKPTH